MTNDKMSKIIIAGASGFIGGQLIQYLLDHTQYKIVALSRQARDSQNSRVEWRKCDLFSMLEIEESIADCEIAYYLVHSMLPSAHLDQGSFSDYDLLLADNFARACDKNKVKKVIYLGGIIPEEKKLSTHLESRLEVEECFREHDFDFIALRAAMIIGAASSSFQILYNLIKKLPIIIAPSWAKTVTAPIHIDDVITIMVDVLKVNLPCKAIYELGGPQQLSYMNLMQVLTTRLGLNRSFIQLDFDITKFSKYWVRLFSGASKELVYPLIESLRSRMVPKNSLLYPNKNIKFKSFEQAIDIELKKEMMLSYQTSYFQRKFVRSVQRVRLPKGADAIWAAKEYMRWLPQFFSPFLKVIVENDVVSFCALSKRIRLLELSYSLERSTPDRALFYITGGMLANVHKKARFEFREVMQERYLITAIHDFHPALPWYIYKITQAPIHAWVMLSFGRHMKRVSLRSHK